MLDDIPLIATLKGRLGYLNQRQRTISQNIANADTPGYVAKDLKAFTFGDAMRAANGQSGVGVMRTNANHVAGASNAVWKSETTPDSETTLDGNSVVLEEQMVKMSESRANYEAAVGFYQKSLSMLRTAVRRPGM